VAEHPPTGPAGAPAPGILVADDDPALLNLLELLLRRRGFDVWAARDGRAAVELFRRHRGGVAVVLLDVRIPGLDGPQALAELRRMTG
jgi:CheY-like chemotaxis protein